MFAWVLDTVLMEELRQDEPDELFAWAQDALDGVCLPPMKSLLSNWCISNNILYYKDRAYVPPAQRHSIVTRLHDHPTAGHPGHFKTEELVKRDYWWPSMGTCIHNYVTGCALCQQMKSDTHPVTPPLMPIDSTAVAPFTHLSMDLIVKLPLSGGFDSILVVVDHSLTKGVILIPCNESIDSEGIAKLFVKHVYRRFSLHEKIISDRGPQFISKFSRALAELLQYKIAASTAYHPQTDGQTERLNQELETYLRIYCRSNPETWVEHLPVAKFVHNHQKHDSRNTSPFFLMMGYEPRTLPHVLQNSAIPAANERVQKLQKIREEAISCHHIAMQRMAQRTHGKKYTPWKIGDKVWLSGKNLITPLPSKKLVPK
jgi:hypothetical protein